MYTSNPDFVFLHPLLALLVRVIFAFTIQRAKLFIAAFKSKVSA